MYGKEILEEIVKKHPDSFPAIKLLENFSHFEGLYKVLDGKWEYGWGSYLFNGQEYKYQSETLKKQEELYCYSAKASNALEIGVYLGHSLLIMLIANPTLKITCIDNEDRFARKAVEYLNLHFNDRVTFIHGDAVSAISKLPTDYFDLIHVDADHNDIAVNAQFNASMRVAKLGAYVVFDDYDAVKTTVDGLIYKGFLKHIVTPQCLWTNCVTQLIAKSEKEGIVEICRQYSALSRERLLNNLDMISYVNARSIDGDIVEVGVFKGGSMLAFIRGGSPIVRHYYLYDTFTGMTPPSDLDRDYNGDTAASLIAQNTDVLCISSLSEVKQNISKNCSLDEKYIHYQVGDIMKNTFYPEKIAVLRLDTDWYESTAFELANFYDKVVSGGVVIIDDYGHWQGCRRAVDEFLVGHPEITLLNIDYTGVYFYKP